MDLKAIKISNLKRSKIVEINTPPLTVIIGGNNSGKSSLIQGVHFAIAVLQATKSSAESGKSMSTLGYDQFIYKPTGDLTGLYHGGPMTSKLGPDFEFSFSSAGTPDPQNFVLKLRRGKNANIATIFDKKNSFYIRASDRTHPLSIFVPGLAGVPLREEKRTASVVTNGIAQGDSNLYLRNILHSIIKDTTKLTRFHEIIGTIFPGLEIFSNFNESVNLYIDVYVKLDGTELPLEMVGTGCLQAIQLVAYVTAYDPALLLLDEPDAHLHPSNQRALASTLKNIAQTGVTKVILATHSRHIFDALASDEETQVIWLKDGTKQEVTDKSSLSIMLDIGALDSYELLNQTGKKIVFLTEDSKIPKIKLLLEANGLSDGDFYIQPLNGVNNLSAAVPIADFFVRQGINVFAVVHRDGDCMTDDEKIWFKEAEKKRFPERTFIFVTPFTDIEHSFCSPEHISAVYGMSLAEAEELLRRVIDANKSAMLVEFAQKRSSLKDTVLRKKDSVPSATELVEADTIEF
jgi:predicted ATPase